MTKIYHQPQLAQRHQIVALSTHVKCPHELLRVVIGDQTETAVVLAGLDQLPK